MTGTILQVGGANFSKPGMTWIPKTTSIPLAWGRFFGGESSLAQATISQDINANPGSLVGTPVLSGGGVPGFGNSIECFGTNIGGIATNFFPQTGQAFTAFLACKAPSWVTGSSATYAMLGGNLLGGTPAADVSWTLANTQVFQVGGVSTSLNYSGGLTPTSPKLYAVVYRPGVNQQIYDITGGTSGTSANTAAITTQTTAWQVGTCQPYSTGYGIGNFVYHASFFAGDLTAYGSGANTDFLNVIAQIRYVLLNKSGITV